MTELQIKIANTIDNYLIEDKQMKRLLCTKEQLAIQIASQLEPLVMPLLIKDEIAQKLIDRLNLYEKQYASDYGFINKQKIAHKVEELKKCIQIVQSA